jgi:predicted pyridoxine 5'-phosphate oxidase superfamily flavin-nucleotide-binding protein
MRGPRSRHERTARCACYVLRMPYHEGELEMQRRAGVRALADRVGGIIGDDIPPAAAAFLAAQRFVVVATVDAGDAPAASLLGGAAGFASARDDRTVIIAPSFGHIEHVAADLEATHVLGLLAIDQARRRRIRVNGNGVWKDRTIVLTTAEVYSNCPQYIRPRIVREREIASTPRTDTSDALSTAQQEWITGADTFFLATAHRRRGADASHRGGPAGFVAIESATRLRWPDYPGNNMFNSLGNLVLHPRCGLLFVDWTRGATLQLRGIARVEGDEERVVSFEVEDVVETADAVPLIWVA